MESCTHINFIAFRYLYKKAMDTEKYIETISDSSFTELTPVNKMQNYFLQNLWVHRPLRPISKCNLQVMCMIFLPCMIFLWVFWFPILLENHTGRLIDLLTELPLVYTCETVVGMLNCKLPNRKLLIHCWFRIFCRALVLYKLISN